MNISTNQPVVGLPVEFHQRPNIDRHIANFGCPIARNVRSDTGAQAATARYYTEAGYNRDADDVVQRGECSKWSCSNATVPTKLSLQQTA